MLHVLVHYCSYTMRLPITLVAVHPDNAFLCYTTIRHSQALLDCLIYVVASHGIRANREVRTYSSYMLMREERKVCYDVSTGPSN